MSGSIEGVVGASQAIENFNVMQDKQNLLLKKVLNNQADTIVSLVDSAPTAPQLAHGGTVGTLLHATA